MNTLHIDKVCLAIGACLFFILNVVQAQQEPEQLLPSTPVCEQDPHFNDWGFWQGDWRVMAGPDKDLLAGHNTITPIENGCAFMEKWEGQGGSSGQSLNYFNPVTGKWRQVWVAPPGYMIDIEGGLKDGSMVLEGEIFYFARELRFPFRGTWTPNADGSVRQYFQQFDPETETWNDWFDGKYIRLEEE